MAQPISFIYVGHLSRRDRAVLEAFNARTAELTADGEKLNWYTDGLPILCSIAHSHYRTAAGAKRAFIRLAEILEGHRQLLRTGTEGRA